MVSRVEHRRTTLLALGEAAVALIERDGTAVTMTQIAEQAGVSRRTVFRHVDAKEELLFVHPILWFDIFDTAIEATVDQPLADRLLYASRTLGAHIDADPEPPRRAFLVTAQHPDLMRGYTGVFQRWIQRVAAEVNVGVSPVTSHDRFRAQVIGSATMGVIDAVTREWLLNPGNSFSSLLEEAFPMLTPLFGVEDR